MSVLNEQSNQPTESIAPITESEQRPPNDHALKDLFQSLDGGFQKRLSDERFRIARDHDIDEADLDAQIEWHYHVGDGLQEPDENYEKWKPFVEEYFKNTKHLRKELDNFIESRTSNDLAKQSVLSIRFLLGGIVTDDEVLSDKDFASIREFLVGENTELDKNMQRTPDDRSYRKAKYLTENYLTSEIVVDLPQDVILPLKKVIFETIKKFRSEGSFETADDWAVQFMNLGVLSGDESELDSLDMEYPNLENSKESG